MNLQQLQSRALAIANKYTAKNQQDGHNKWDSSAYMAGFVGDVGDLSKLVMAYNNFRATDDVDAKLAHELGDCLWSLLVLADKLGVDIEKSFLATMDELDQRLAS